ALSEEWVQRSGVLWVLRGSGRTPDATALPGGVSDRTKRNEYSYPYSTKLLSSMARALAPRIPSTGGRLPQRSHSSERARWLRKKEVPKAHGWQSVESQRPRGCAVPLPGNPRPHGLLSVGLAPLSIFFCGS